MDNDDLFDIIEPSEEQKDNKSDSEGDFVQDDSFVNSLDFVNGFSDATDSEIDKLLDEAGDIAQRFHIQSIPTLMLFHDGKIANTTLGYMPKPQLLNFLK